MKTKQKLSIPKILAAFVILYSVLSIYVSSTLLFGNKEVASDNGSGAMLVEHLTAVDNAYQELKTAISASPYLNEHESVTLKKPTKKYQRAIDKASDFNSYIANKDVNAALAATFLDKHQARLKNVNTFIQNHDQLQESIAKAPLLKRNVSVLAKEMGANIAHGIITNINSAFAQTKELQQSADLKRMEGLLATQGKHRERLTTLYPNLKPSLESYYQGLTTILNMQNKHNTLASKLVSEKEGVSLLGIVAAQKEQALVDVSQSIEGQTQAMTLYAVFSLFMFVGMYGLHRKSMSVNEGALLEQVELKETVVIQKKTIESLRDDIEKLSLQQARIQVSEISEMAQEESGHDPIAELESDIEVEFDLALEGEPEEVALEGEVLASIEVEEIESAPADDELIQKLCREIETPLSFVNKNVESLTPILTDLYDVLDELEKADEKDLSATEIRLLKQSGSVNELPFMVSDIAKGIETVNVFTKNLNKLSSADPKELSLIDVNDLMRDILKMKVGNSTASTKVHFNLTSEKAQVVANMGEVRHALDCIVQNAIEANVANDAAQDKIEVSTKINQDTLFITVRDNGLGMDAGVTDRIFDPFFSLKESNSKGMGLTFAKNNIEKFDGKIDVVSEPEKGTIMRIGLPVATPEAAQNYLPEPVTANEAEQERITSKVRKVVPLDLHAVISQLVERKRFENSSLNALELNLSEDEAKVAATAPDMMQLVGGLLDLFVTRSEASLNAKDIAIKSKTKGDAIVITIRDCAEQSDKSKNYTPLEQIPSRSPLKQHFVQIKKITEKYNGGVSIATSEIDNMMICLTLPRDRSLAQVAPDNLIKLSDHDGTQKATAKRKGSEVIPMSAVSGGEVFADDFEENARFGDEGVIINDKQGWLSIV